jgi:hypothetical protein
MDWELLPRGRDRVRELAAAAAEAGAVVLATDPDREGEAISWHVMQELEVGGGEGDFGGGGSILRVDRKRVEVAARGGAAAPSCCRQEDLPTRPRPTPAPNSAAARCAARP